MKNFMEDIKKAAYYPRRKAPTAPQQFEELEASSLFVENVSKQYPYARNCCWFSLKEKNLITSVPSAVIQLAAKPQKKILPCSSA